MGRTHTLEELARRARERGLVVAGAGDDRAAVVLLDDLHLASSSNREAPLAHAGVQLVVATARRSPSARAVPVQVAAFQRHARALDLEPLPSDALLAVASRAAEAPIPPDAAAILVRRSGGNPRLAQELGAFWAGAEGPERARLDRLERFVPRFARETLAEVLEAADPATRQLLQVAGVLGRSFEADLLGFIVGEPEQVVRDRLDEAIELGLVEEDADAPKSLRFLRVMASEVLEEGLRPSDRRRLHGAAARGIEALRNPGIAPWSAKVADHRLHEGADAEKAAGWALHAGAQALMEGGQRETERLTSRALEWLRNDPPSSERAVLCGRLDCLLGNALAGMARRPEAREAYRRAMAAAEDSDDADLLGAAALGFAGEVDTATDPEPESEAFLRTALSRIDPATSRSLRVRSRLATALVLTDPREARAMARDVVAEAERRGDSNEFVYSATALAWSLFGTTHGLAERVEVIDRALARCHEPAVELPQRLLAVYHGCLNALEQAEPAALAEGLDKYSAWIGQRSNPFHRWQEGWLQANYAMLRGELPRAEELAHAAHDLGVAAGSPNSTIVLAGQLFAIRREQGRLGELVAQIGGAATMVAGLRMFQFARAEAHLSEGREAEAAALLTTSAATGWSDLPDDWTRGALISVAVRLCTGLNDAGAARSLYEATAPQKGGCLLLGPCGWDGAVDHHLGRLAAVFGDDARAEAHLQDAFAIHSRAGARLYMAHDLRELGVLHRRSEGPDSLERSTRCLVKAAELYRELGLAELEVSCRADAVLDGPEGDGIAPASIGSETAQAWRSRTEEWLARGMARDRIGDRSAAREAYSRAVHMARAAELPGELARAVLGLRGDMRAGNSLQAHDAAHLAELDEALGRLREDEPALRARLLGAIAVETYWGRDFERTDRAAAEGLALARSYGSSELVLEALLASIVAGWYPHRLDERLRLCDEAVELARRENDPRARLLALHYRAMARFEACDRVGLETDMVAAVNLSRRDEHRLLAHLLGNLKVVRLMAEGRYEECRAAADAQLQEGNALGAQHAPILHLTHVMNLDMHTQGGEATLDRMRAVVETNPLPVLRAGLAYVWCMQGDSAQCRAEMDVVLAGGVGAIPRDFFWFGTLIYLAECAVALRDPELVEALHAELSPFAGRYALLGFGASVMGCIDRPLGLLAGARGDSKAALRHLQDAVALEREMGSTAFQVLALEALADQPEEDAGDADRSASLRAEADRLRIQIGMRWRPPGHRPPPVATARVTPRAALVFDSAGGRWWIEFRNRRRVLPKMRGLFYLAELLREPNRELHVLDLLQRVAPDPIPGSRGGADETLDDRARREIRRRMQELVATIEDAEARGDPGPLEAARSELETLEDSLSAALGLGGRARTSGDPVERARKSVYNRLRAAIKRIGTEFPEVERHLEYSVRTGRTCAYAPEELWDWDFGA